MKLLPILSLHKMQLLLFVHKYVFSRNTLPEVFHDYFIENSMIHSHCTRSQADFHILPIKSTFGQKSSNFKACKLWNELPEQLKHNSSLLSFKKNLKLMLMI